MMYFYSIYSITKPDYSIFDFRQKKWPPFFLCNLAQSFLDNYLEYCQYFQTNAQLREKGFVTVFIFKLERMPKDIVEIRM